MATTTSFSYRALPSLSAAPTTSKPVSNLNFSFGFVNKPIRMIADAREGRKTGVLVRYGGGARRVPVSDEDEGGEEDETVWVETEKEEREYDPNLDLDRILTPTVRLLDEQNNMVGVMTFKEALKKSEGTGLILAIVSVDAEPPVVRLFDEGYYRKHKYEKKKKKRVQQKQSSVRTKEVKMGYKIENHDYSVRLKQGIKFLKEGHKVKAIVNMRGREHMHKSQAIDRLKKFQTDIGKMAIEESKNFEEKNIYIILKPNKANIQREAQFKQKEEAEALKRKQSEESQESIETQEPVETQDSIETEEKEEAVETQEPTEIEKKEEAPETEAISTEEVSVNV